VKDTGPRKVTYRYSESFKQMVISQIEKGELTKQEAMQVYGINGSETINGWLKAYGKYHLINRVVRIEMKDEKDINKELRSQMKELKDALASVTVHNIAMQSYIDVVNENISEEEKKTLLSKLSPEQQKTFARLRQGHQ